MNARLQDCACACCAEKETEVIAMREAFANHVAALANEIKTLEKMLEYGQARTEDLLANGRRKKAGWPAELERRHPARVARDAEKAAKAERDAA